MIGQQLDLFGGPLRPPKKILVDEQPEELKESSAESKPTQDAAVATDDPANNDVEIPASPLAAQEDALEEVAETINATDSSEADVTSPEVTQEVAVVEEPEAIVDVEENETEVVSPQLEAPAEENESVAEEDESAAIEEEPAPEIATETPEIVPEPVAPELEAIPEPLGVEELDEADAKEPESVFEDNSVNENASADSKADNVEIQQVAFRGRKSGDPDEEMEMLNVPPDEALFKRQYYSMRETAAMFNVNQALLRFWENEFDILQPKKNKKGDRYFRPVDVKNLVLIYHLLRVRKFTMEGAKDYLHTHKKAGDSFQLVQRLEKLKSFLLELKANL